jgi:hypothetical protein
VKVASGNIKDLWVEEATPEENISFTRMKDREEHKPETLI